MLTVALPSVKEVKDRIRSARSKIMVIKDYEQGFSEFEFLIFLLFVAVFTIIFSYFVSDIQKSIRDSKRKADIETISLSLEAHYNRLANQYCASLSPDSYCYPKVDWFNDQMVPRDPLGGQYLGLPKDGDKHYQICAKLEKEENNASSSKLKGDNFAQGYFCQNSQQ